MVEFAALYKMSILLCRRAITAADCTTDHERTMIRHIENKTIPKLESGKTEVHEYSSRPSAEQVGKQILDCYYALNTVLSALNGSNPYEQDTIRKVKEFIGELGSMLSTICGVEVIMPFAKYGEFLPQPVFKDRP